MIPLRSVVSFFSGKQAPESHRLRMRSHVASTKFTVLRHHLSFCGRSNPNLIRLPSNFRVLITSRPEDGIESALVGAQSVKIKHMKDSELAAKTHDDILAFLRERLPSDKFRDYGDDL